MLSPLWWSLLVSDSLGGCTNKEMHPWKALCDLILIFHKIFTNINYWSFDIPYYIHMYIAITIQPHMPVSVREDLLEGTHIKWCTLKNIVWLNCVDVQYNVITYYKYLFFFCKPYLIISIKWTLDKFIPLDMLVGLWCPKGCSSQAMHPQKDVFDLCPVFTKILTCHNSLLYW